MNQNFTNPSHAQPSDTVLTPLDVERLLRDDSPDSRHSILEKIAGNYNADALQGRAREIAEQIFRLLMKDVALRVREALSEGIKSNLQVPRDIVLHLAQDVTSVATPVLRYSKVLSDADLVSIVEHSRSEDIEKLIAITQRELVSTRVSDALVDTRYAPVMSSLLANEGASVGERALEKIAEDFRGDETVLQALMKKPSLPITVVERLISQVSHAVASELRSKYKLNDQAVVRDTSQAREDFMVRLLEQDLSQDEIEALVSQMAAEDRLTPSIVMTALCRGQLTFFTVALAQFASIPVSNAATLIADRGDNGINGLYRKSGLPEAMIDAVRLLLRAVQEMKSDRSIPGSMLYANRLSECVIRMAANQQIEYLPYFIALIRQHQHRG
jgi:uncharacterized protein (DUF2336 family)